MGQRERFVKHFLGEGVLTVDLGNRPDIVVDVESFVCCCSSPFRHERSYPGLKRMVGAETAWAVKLTECRAC
jgi:hypothetical protein